MDLKALHLSHTDILQDSRILKEIDSLSDGLDILVVGWGVSADGARVDSVSSVVNRAVGFNSRWKLLSRVAKVAMRLAAFLRLTWRGAGTSADIVHCHDWFVLPIGLLHKLRWSSRLVYDAHELESDTNTRSRFRKRTAFWVEWVAWRWVDGFVTVSDSIMEWYGKTFGRAPVSAVVLNSPVFGSTAPPVLTPEERAEIRASLSLTPEQRVGVYVGGLEGGRGLEIILEAVSRIPDDTHFVIIGYGSAESRLEALAEALGCRNVSFLGRMPHDEVVRFISAFDYGVCLIEPVSLSDVYSLPNKLFEYGFAGLHIIGSDLPEIRGFLDTTGLGSVVRLDAAELRSAIASVSTPTGQRSRPTPSWEYGWGHQGEKLVGLYKRVISP